jgi:hypothetical protein
MQKLLLALFAFVTAQKISAQRENYDWNKPRISSYATRPDTSVYSALHEIWNANLPVSYVSLPMIGMYTKSIERVGPLVLGEGVNGYILEGITDLNFILNQGRRQQAHWKQTTRIAFKYAPGLRMTEDNSSNLLPTNQKVGFQFDKVLWDSYTNVIFTESEGSTSRNERKNFFVDKAPLHSLNFTFIAMHFSNGQPDGSYRSVDSARNDYIKGDFSTNLLQPSFTYNYYTKKRQLLSVNLGYQKDLNIGGPLAFLDVQHQRYGENRIIGYLQWRSMPRTHWLGLTKDVKGTDGHNYRIHRKWEYRYRWEFEYILGDLSKFKRSQDYRFNWHLYLEAQPMRSRAVGYVFHLFRGRDYFNIRYDDITWVAHVGLSFTINRYHNPRFHPDETIKENGDEPKFYQKQSSRQKNKTQ